VSLAVDASSPSAAIGSGATTVTGAFTPPDNTLLVAFCAGDANNGSLDEDQTVTDSTSTTWTKKVLRNGNGGACVTVHYRRIVGTSPGSITATQTDTKGSVAKRIFVRVFTDAATGIAPDIGATAVSGSANVSLTTTVNNSWVWSIALTANVVLTAGTGCTQQDDFGGFDSGDAVQTESQTSLTTTAGTLVTNGLNGTSTVPHNVAIEIIPGASSPAETNYAGPWTGPTPGMLGPTGAWTPQRLPAGALYSQALAGTLTTAGALTKVAAAAKSGAVTPSGGLAKQDAKAISGAVTPAGSVAKQDQKPLAGAIAASGAVARQARKALAGAVAGSGGLIRQIGKALAGAVTPAGALSTVKVVLRAFAGALTPSGAVTKVAGKGVAGGLTPAGAVSKAARNALSGGLTAAGALAKTIGRHLAGALAAAGALNLAAAGGAARATSTPDVSDRRTSTPVVADRNASTAAITARRTSTPGAEG
jgi:hypothetical protein